MRFHFASDSKRAFALALLLLIGFLATGSLTPLAQTKPSPAKPKTPAPAPAEKSADFDAARAYEHVKRMVAMGPRPSGSEAIKKTQDYIEAELKGYGLKITEDNFTASTPNGPVIMKNIMAVLPGEKPEIVLITGHYDTKQQPGFVGANDGGSSAAAVLEMARVLSKTRPEYTLWFVLFDGEEAVVDWSAMDGMDNTYGSRHVVLRLQAEGTISRVRAMILVDMIGDKELNISQEAGSSPWLNEIVWQTARKIGYGKHFINREQSISDDHVPFREAGIPVIDIIDFEYGEENSYWHTNADALDKISGESMKVVGDTVIRALPEIFKYLNDPSHLPPKPSFQ
jgi:glutaminyl-peptide cyclotransferase